MILVDTNIIIDFWKNPESKIRDIFIQEDIATCGIILAELIHGAKSEKESAIIQEALSAFNYLDIRKNDWVGIGSLLNNLKKLGVTIPFQDAVLSYLAISRHLELWSNDKHFTLISKVNNKLVLFHPYLLLRPPALFKYKRPYNSNNNQRLYLSKE